MGLRQISRQNALHSPISAAQRLRVQASRRQLIRTCTVGPQLATSISLAPGLKSEPWTDSPGQQNALAELKQRFYKDAAPPDEATLKWYLRDRYFDVDEAEQKLRSMLNWRKTFQPQSTTPQMVAAELASGKAYVHKYTDKYGRPPIVVRTRLHITGRFPLSDSKRLAAYLIDTAISQIPPGGEQIVGIFDLRGFQFAHNADFQLAAFLVEAFFEYYPRRVSQVLFVDAPWVFFPAWEIIKPLMRKYASLVRFCSVADLRSEFFTPETLPSDFR